MNGTSLHGTSRVQGARCTVSRITRLLIGLQCALMCRGWLYRATLYSRIPVVRGNPFGLGDIIELIVYFALIASSAIALGAAGVCAVVPALRGWRNIGALTAAGLLTLPLFLYVHMRLRS